MAEHKHQQQDLRAGLQHLANRQQEASAHPVRGLEQSPQHQAQVIHQHQVGAQPQQHQAAVIAVQDLERQRLRLLQDLVENPPQ